MYLHSHHNPQMVTDSLKFLVPFETPAAIWESLVICDLYVTAQGAVLDDLVELCFIEL